MNVYTTYERIKTGASSLLYKPYRITRTTAKKLLDGVLGPLTTSSGTIDIEELVKTGELKEKHICCLARLGGAGDRVFEMYALLTFAKKYNIQIDVITRKGQEHMFASHPNVREVHGIEEGSISALLHNSPLTYTPDIFISREGKSTNWRARIQGLKHGKRGTQFVWLTTNSDELNTQRSTIEKLTEELSEQLHTTLELQPDVPVLHLSETEKNYLKAREEEHNILDSDTVITICVGAKDMSRNYHQRQETIELIHAKHPDAKIILSGDEHAEQRATSIYKTSGGPDRLISMAGKVTFSQAKAILGRSDVALANDSGPGNFAMGLGRAKVIMIYSRVSSQERIPNSFSDRVIGINTGCSGHNKAHCPYGEYTPICNGGKQEYCSCMRSVKPESIVTHVTKFLD